MKFIIHFLHSQCSTDHKFQPVALHPALTNHNSVKTLHPALIHLIYVVMIMHKVHSDQMPYQQLKYNDFHHIKTFSECTGTWSETHLIDTYHIRCDLRTCNIVSSPLFAQRFLSHNSPLQLLLVTSKSFFHTV